MYDKLRRSNHSVSCLLVHLVFVVKYRRSVISPVVWSYLQRGFARAAEAHSCVLVEANHDKNHAHLVLEYPPSVSLATLVGALKGQSSFLVRRACSTELLPRLWGGAFWSPSYFAASCGGAPLETLKRYVQSQQTKTG